MPTGVINSSVKIQAVAITIITTIIEDIFRQTEVTTAAETIVDVAEFSQTLNIREVVIQTRVMVKIIKIHTLPSFKTTSSVINSKYSLYRHFSTVIAKYKKLGLLRQ